MSAYSALAIHAGVPFGTDLPEEVLRGVLETGIVPDAHWPHLHRALTEAPIEMIASVVFGTPAGTRRNAVVANLRKVAEEVGALPRIARWLSG